MFGLGSAQDETAQDLMYNADLRRVVLPPCAAEAVIDSWRKSMRMPSSVFAVTGKSFALLVVAGSIVMLSGQRNADGPTSHLVTSPTAQAAVQFVNPGLAFSLSEVDRYRLM